MKICIVSMEYPPESGWGGIGTQSYLKAHGLTARGHTVHVVSVAPDHQPRSYRDGAAWIHRLAPPRPGFPLYEPPTYSLAHSLQVAGKLHELDQQLGFEIFQFADYNAEGFVFQTDTFRYRKAKYVLQLHGPLAMFSKMIGWPDAQSVHFRVGDFLERLAIEHTDGVMASSRAVAEFAEEHFGYPAAQTTVVHSGVDTVHYHPQPQPADPASPRLLFVGKIVGNKGITTVVEALLGLRRRFPKIKLRAIGRADEGCLASLRRKIAAAGAMDHFEFTGLVSRNDLPAHYAWCDFLVAPSTFEVMGNIYLEAMACERAVIAAAVGGVPEVVLADQTGLLVNPQAVAELQAAIQRLADDPDERQRLARNGRQWIQERFTMAHYAARIEAVYAGLVEK